MLNAPFTAYAAWNKDREQYLASSSGGAAHVFSSHIIKRGGIVYGCTSEGMHIRHIRVDSLSELSKLQGSKYVQSDVRGLFSQAKADLKAGKPVLFIGTPCQVAGLKNYIKNIPEHLFLVDLICHGVPSQQMLHEHICRIAKGRTAERLFFREGQTFRMELQGGSMRYGATKQWCYVSEPHKDMYYRAFLNGISYRKSCYRCKFAQSERVSDITIGDFWGLQDDNGIPKQGVSVVLPSTDKGVRLLKAVESKLALKERDMEKAIKGNDQLQAPTKSNHATRSFQALYPTLPFDWAVFISLVIRKLRLITKI